MTDNQEIQPILDYTARDFDAIRSMLVGTAKGKMPEWETLGEVNDIGTLLLEIFAYMGDTTNYYIDRIASEAFLGTAQRRQSVLYLAEMLGYKPLGQQAASVLLSVTLAADANGSVTIEGGEEVTAADGTAFTTDFTITLEPGETKQVSATEGVVVNQVFASSKGAPNYEITIPNAGVVNRSLTIKTKEGVNYGGTSDFPAEFVSWFEVNAVSTALPTQSAYSTYLDDNGFTHVLFGDSAAGRIPPPGAEIHATYRYGTGAAANKLVAGDITAFSNTELPTAQLEVTNTGAPVGGSDPESIDSMRFSVPKAASTRSRAVTLEDYNSLALQVPGVAKAVAYGQTYSAVNIRIAPVGGVVEPALMAGLRNDVETYLKDKVLVGSTLYVEDVQWTDIWITMDLYVLDGFDQSQVESNVQLALEDYLSFSNQNFGGRITVGSVYRRAMSVEGVDYVDVNTLRTNTTTGVANREIPELRIARIHPVNTDIEADPYGLQITSYGGLGS